jgi:glycosyltransferase involved in cell wall biosynthesis
VNKPFVSIIIPYYKAKDTILRAIKSIENQRNSDWELLIVDDGSEDGIEDYLSNTLNEKIRLLKKANSGPSASRNYGVDHALGEFLAFLDSDDWLSPDWLARFKSTFQVEPYEIAYCYGSLVDEKTKERIDWNRFEKFQIKNEDHKFNNLVGTFIVSKSIFEKAGRFDPALRYSENMDLALRVINFNEGLRKQYIEENLVFFGNTTDSKSRNGKYGRALLLKDLNYFQSKHQRILEENPTFLRAIIRRQLVCATVCLEPKRYLVKLKQLFQYSWKDGMVYSLLFIALPINHFRLRRFGFRK